MDQPQADVGKGGKGEDGTTEASRLSVKLGLVGGGDPSADDFVPTNSLVTPLLNDLYELTMAYAYWKAQPQTILFLRSFLDMVGTGCVRTGREA